MALIHNSKLSKRNGSLSPSRAHDIMDKMRGPNYEDPYSDISVRKKRNLGNINSKSFDGGSMN